MSTREIMHFHLFAGLGGAARGFNRGEARVGQTSARFRCIGGVDVDRAAAGDFARVVGAPCTVLDLFDREQYEVFHGAPPPSTWREATADDIREAAGGERPHVLFLSPPCKGFSGLLSEERSKSGRYQALNRLTIRGLALALEAWGDDPPEFVLLENVPRIANRGRPLLNAIEALLIGHGYAVAETTHDCGALGNLAQTRKRFLLVVRPEVKPKVAADGCGLPFRDSSFKAVLLDPPYSDEYARNLYGTKNPRPSATDAGLEALGPDVEQLPTGDELREHWLRKLPAGERAVLEAVIAAYPKAVRRDELELDYQRSSRDTYLQRLSARKLVETPGPGLVRASEELFG